MTPTPRAIPQGGLGLLLDNALIILYQLTDVLDRGTAIAEEAFVEPLEIKRLALLLFELFP